MLSDLAAIARAAREAPEQLDRMLELGEEIAEIGRAVLEIAERLDERAAAILVLGERLDERAEAILVLGARLDARAEAILELGERLDGRTAELIDLGVQIHALGDRVDARGAEVARQAGDVVDTATELITVLPTGDFGLKPPRAATMVPPRSAAMCIGMVSVRSAFVIMLSCDESCPAPCGDCVRWRFSSAFTRASCSCCFFCSIALTCDRDCANCRFCVSS